MNGQGLVVTVAGFCEHLGLGGHIGCPDPSR